MKTTPYTFVGIGEILWDLFPNDKRLGGAPANFTYFANVLGNHGIVVSRIGDDNLGNELRAKMQDLGLTPEYLQIDTKYPTGVVNVTFTSAGQPDYSIKKNVAWDFLEWNLYLEQLANKTDVVCFGTLGQRSRQSSQTIRRFLKNTRENALRVFDVNLRQLYYSAEVLLESLALSQVVKLSEKELWTLVKILHLKKDQEADLAQQLIRIFDLSLVCITRGACGSLLVSKSEVDEYPGIEVKVQDTVGAGDAFTAAVAHHCLRGSNLKIINEVANRLGAYVVSKAGATPVVENELIEEIALCD
ncbi:MAG: carbohydrate kinase [bacterium]